MQHNNPEDAYIDVGIWKSDMDLLKVSMDGVNIPLFLNFLDIVAQTILVLLILLK